MKDFQLKFSYLSKIHKKFKYSILIAELRTNNKLVKN